ncbi:lipid-A-disaccharide synthase [Allohahella marinimesophila]|uniref:Lipid-A-disaccharide synthase n=1 Tax=Allohahella marinimesophila TaxID=1054972 RepID=A0ABP7PQ47_9GAMM
MRVAIVAGEASGDLLGAGLIHALRAQYPDAEFGGMGGPLMQGAGCESLFPMEHLSIMGLVEVLDSLPQLFELRARLLAYFVGWKADVFIGIDAPDFNLRLASKLKMAGIPTVHYVSPSVWAWRQGRIHGIKRSVDLMLTLLPFEADFYEHWRVPVAFVGHPLADEIPLGLDKAPARGHLGLAKDHSAPVYAILPGSRGSEVSRLGKLFFQAARLLKQQQPGAVFLVPASSELREAQLNHLLTDCPDLTADNSVRVLQGQARMAMQAADGVILASGTASLEAMLVGRPMVVAYRLARPTYWIMKRLMKSKYIALPNLLADEALVPELIQDDVTPERIAEALLKETEPARAAALTQRFAGLHELIHRNASERAAKAIRAQILDKVRDERADG